MNNTKETVYLHEDGLDYHFLTYNDSSFYYDDESTILYHISRTVMTILCAAYGVIFLAAISGNILVCYTVSSLKTKSSSRQDVPNFFMLSLSINDIILIIVCIPILVFSKVVYNYWPFGAWMCTSSGFVQNTIFRHRAFTLVIITNDCHNNSWKPYGRRLTKNKAKLIVMGSFFIAAIFSIPIAMYSTTREYFTSAGLLNICVEQWPLYEVNKAYRISLIVVQYIIPLTTLIVCYTHIGIIISSSRIPGDANGDTGRQTRKQKTVLMMIISVVCYALCWTPLNVINILGEITPSLFEHQYFHLIWLFSHCLAYSNALVNPILYSWMKQSYRTQYKNFVRKICCLSEVKPVRNASFSTTNRLAETRL